MSKQANRLDRKFQHAEADVVESLVVDAVCLVGVLGVTLEHLKLASFSTLTWLFIHEFCRHISNRVHWVKQSFQRITASEVIVSR